MSGTPAVFSHTELEAMLIPWAALLTSDVTEQRILVLSTIMTAADDPQFFESGDVHQSLKGLMHTLFMRGSTAHRIPEREEVTISFAELQASYRST